MLSVCDHAKSCDVAAQCYKAKQHVCEDSNMCGVKCLRFPSAKCVAAGVESKPKPKRVRQFKDDVVAENARLKMRVHQLEVAAKTMNEMPFLWRLVWAINGGSK